MKKAFSMVTAAILFFACAPEHKEGKTVETAVTEEGHKHPGATDEVKIELNDGRKWKVNDEMMVHVQNMEGDIQSFQGQSLEEYKALASKIKGHIGELTSACTMTGPSHEELHKWLHPFIELTEEFAHSESTASAQQQFKEIKKQMEVFHQYFE